MLAHSGCIVSSSTAAQSGQLKWPQYWNRMLRAGCLMACSFFLSGCVSVSTLQDWQFKRINKSRANDAYRDCFTRQQRSNNSPDFESGYKTGFVDAATGKDCHLPAVPPEKYWSAKYQCCEGQSYIQDWYKGYQCGMSAAESRGFPSFHEVPLGPCAPVLNKTGCGACYAGDPCHCNVCSGDAPMQFGHQSPVMELSENYTPIQSLPGSPTIRSSNESTSSELPNASFDDSHVSTASATTRLIGPVDL
ncbi:MAG: hypothetical protein R3C53_13430 [Pirellulaceae bacterium]